MIAASSRDLRLRRRIQPPPMKWNTMDIQEFDALRQGHKIRNLQGDVGVITGTSPSAVHVQWSKNPASPTFQLVRAGTAWFSMEVVTDDVEA